MRCAANTEIENHCILTGYSYAYGQSAGMMHKYSSSFKPKEQFTQIDLEYLIWKPLSLIKKYFTDVDITYAQNIAKRVNNELASLNHAGLTKSYIHGDLTGGNACLSNTNEYLIRSNPKLSLTSIIVLA